MGGTMAHVNRRDFVKAALAGAAGLAITSGRIGLSQAASPASVVGQWSAVHGWPDVAIHVHLLPNGKILSYSDDGVPGLKERRAGHTKAFVVDIPPGGAPASSVAYIPNDETNLFCSGHAFLPDGRLLVVGGHVDENYYGAAEANIFEHQGQYRWVSQTQAPMNAGRWYASAITLANGEVLALGGTINGQGDPNRLAQVWRTNQGGGWRSLTSTVATVPNYAKIFLAPNGKVFMAGPTKETQFLDTAGTGAWSKGPTRRFGSRSEGSAVMYDDGKVLLMGGGATPTNTAEIIDLAAASPAWQWTGPMQFARRHMNATLLPDGTVLATGGSSAPANNASKAVLAAELWDPATGAWTTLASMQVARIYHSSAILLPDGRVLSAGGGRPKATNGGTNNQNVEIFSPPYLFKGPRPTIGSAPASLTYGQTFQVGTPDAASVARVTLVRLSSVTHTFNMNQRIKRLSLTRGAGSLSVSVPGDRNLLPPGPYMLFLLDGQGVPSIAKILMVS
jgi:hypothetical protein